MTRYYVDTSVVVRALDQGEPGWATAYELWVDAANQFVVVHLIVAELASALGRKFREGQLSLSLRDLYLSNVVNRIAMHTTVNADHSVVDSAAQLVFRHPLRAYDAIHIAAALRVARLAEPNDPLIFVTADAAQARAAEAEGLAVELVADGGSA